MLKKTIQYEDFNGTNQTENLYFNVSKSELTDHLELVDEVEGLQAMIEGEPRELTTEEVRRLLDLVKKLIKMSYGRRSEDGSRFRKNDEIWEDFTASAAYDAFLMSLFENPEEAVSFIVGIMPGDLIEQAQKETGIQLDGRPVETVELPTNKEPKEQWALQKKDNWFDYTEEELLGCTQQEFDAVYNEFKGPKPAMLVTIAMKRKN